MTDTSTPADGGRVLLVATDGSEQADAALTAGLRLADGPRTALIVTVVPAADPSVLVGSGHAGPVMTPSEKHALTDARQQSARQILDDAARLLTADHPDVRIETEILAGDPGDEICRAAADHGAAAIVLGTRGQGGLKRALLGSVSDHVVRHAPCPVVTVNAA